MAHLKFCELSTVSLGRIMSILCCLLCLGRYKAHQSSMELLEDLGKSQIEGE